MAMSPLRPKNQVIKREEESGENLRSNCKQKGKQEKFKIELSCTLASPFEYLL